MFIMITLSVPFDLVLTWILLLFTMIFFSFSCHSFIYFLFWSVTLLALLQLTQVGQLSSAVVLKVTCALMSVCWVLVIRVHPEGSMNMWSTFKCNSSNRHFTLHLQCEPVQAEFTIKESQTSVLMQATIIYFTKQLQIFIVFWHQVTRWSPRQTCGWGESGNKKPAVFKLRAELVVFVSVVWPCVSECVLAVVFWCQVMDQLLWMIYVALTLSRNWCSDTFYPCCGSRKVRWARLWSTV